MQTPPDHVSGCLFSAREKSLLTRIDRTKRVKDARTEAQKEIEEYRRQKEEEFRKFEAEVCCFRISPAFWPTRIAHWCNNQRMQSEDTRTDVV